ncbi:hypothetical protein FRC09_006120 [Ceratobasidium sp. 395]|nr:hypothetical protein FRC09_006120 [Ceratobasidium sp. 395]
MAQANRWGNGSSAQISHSWGQDPAESAGDSSLIAPWLDDGPESGPSRQATLEPPSPPATKRSFLSSKTSLHSASLRTMQHQPSIGSISLFKSARPTEPVMSEFGTLAPPAPMGHGEVSPSTSKKPKGILLGLLKRKTSRANVRPGSAGGDEESYSTYSQSTLTLAGPSNSTPNILPPSPPASSHAPKKKAKTSRARAQPQPVAEFTLDTNLDEMDGIIARPGPQYPPWHDDASDGSHMSNIVGPTGMTGVQSPTAAFFTDPFSASVFPASPRSTGTASTIIARQIAEPPLQANGHRPGSPTAGVGPSSGIVRNIPSPTLPRSDWAAPESWAVDGTGPKEEDYSSESDDGLAPSTHTIPATSLPGRSDSLAGSINTTRLWKPPGSAGSGANRDAALNGGAFNGGAFGRMGADIMSGGASTRGDRRLNSAGSMRSYAPTLVNGIGAAMAARGSEATVSKGPSVSQFSLLFV